VRSIEKIGISEIGIAILFRFRPIETGGNRRHATKLVGRLCRGDG
jgi:hypothetical protein